MDVARAQKYLSEIFHQELWIEPYKSKLQNLPPFLLGEFEHYTVRIIDTDILLLWRKNSDAISPALLKKRIAAAVDGWNGPVCVGLDKVTAYTRKQLIEKDIQFVVPGTQLYLPCVGTDLRERYSSLKKAEDMLSPSAQLLLLLTLKYSYLEMKGRDTAERLKISQMTVTRAFGELESHGLCQRTGIRRNTAYHFDGDPVALWDKAEAHLSSPIKKSVWISRFPSGLPSFLSGLAALAEYTFIAADDLRTIAVSSKTAKAALAMPEVLQLPYQEPGSVLLEIWKYDPEALAEGKTVDRRSLYLCFKDEKDDRIQIELERMKSKW